MSRLLIIGCGGVAGVAIHKCCQNSDVFTEIMIASRTKEKCDALKEKIESLGGKVSGSISKKVTALINNDVNSTSSKNTKAKSLGVKIMSEDEFLEYIS